MTFKEVARFILEREKRSMSAKEITEIALRENLIDSPKNLSKLRTKIYDVMYNDFMLHGDSSTFVKVGKGIFALREHCAERRREGSELEDLIRRLEETQYKSVSPSEFEETLRDAFSFLGFETELIGTPGNTDVLLKAEVGERSYSANVDGKTSKRGKIDDVQIDWLSLKDHKEKTEADFVVVVGPDFAGGNLEKRAQQNRVVLLKTKDLIEILKEHVRFPFNLVELRELFETPGNSSQTVKTVIEKHRDRTRFLEHLKLLLDEMKALQKSWLRYFSIDSLSAREKIQEAGLKPQEVKEIINFLKSPLIKAVEENSDGKYFLITSRKNVSEIFKRIAESLEEVYPANNEESTLRKLLKDYLLQNKDVPRWIRNVLLPLCLKLGTVTREVIKKELIRQGEAKDMQQAGLVLTTISKSINDHDFLEKVIRYDRPKPWIKENYRIAEEYAGMVKDILDEIGNTRTSNDSSATKKFATKYFEWEVRKSSVVARARKEKPYNHSCSLEYFRAVMRKTLEAFKTSDEVSALTIASSLKDEELTPGRKFHGRSEKYKIDMALGILELEGFIEWTGRKMPVSYRLKKPVEEIEKWMIKKFG
ncbi:hypothetical protein AS159_05305 [Thermotoga sp. Ku-13t]|uniref:winged helix-turn-helix domain-containing protein n=1 Tax=Thermotoga sp. Ku-13t TaxID=1755813 RepID=UPI0013EADF95|nr:winged helix-turn-helix domain-containing protein [Thermotoga sp. Ku-13t]KAF2957822.1 hypothetical protein AS159_05305 [Thermotoga sp. Ku-13t]